MVIQISQMGATQDAYLPPTALREHSSIFPHMNLNGVIIQDQVQILTTTRHNSIEYWQHELLSPHANDKLTVGCHPVIDPFCN